MIAKLRHRLDPRVVRDPIELALMRCGLCAISFYGVWKYYPWFDEQPHPEGIARFVDLTWLATDSAYFAVLGLIAFAAIVHVFGRAPLVVLPVLFFLTTAAFTLKNSQGALSHGTHIVPLVLFGQIVAHAQFAWFTRGNDATATIRGRTREELAVDYGLQMIVAMYLLTAITKLARTGGTWIKDLPMMSVSFVKANDLKYYTDLAPPDGLERSLAIGNFLAGHPMLTQFVIGSGLVLEAAAILALFGRLGAFVIGAGLLAMHVGIKHLLAIEFRLNIWIIVVYLVNVPFVAAWIARKFTRRRAAGGGTGEAIAP